ncbi:agmatinase [Halolactibacillus miurensis]|uniref:Agmatinase n=1 Tax=Halolactibacillus miurensis TaxID=306541 RepID=A0A1I6Q1J1_9BACI|nr:MULTISPECIES: agmatinase [Halolactibacillus]GEM03349.1 agmatinase [Halolactibacillus miurensis]SFS46326.1 agmatinase [Halolactibacillus miurensis]
MRFDEAYSGKVFIASQNDYDNADVVLYGMPMDWTVSFRPGSRFGPNRIREVSIGLEEYSPYLDRELTEINVFDAGDIPLPFGNPEKSVKMIKEYVSTLMDAGKMPFGLGGEHLVTLPVVEAIYEKTKDLTLIHIDAHTDLRDHYEGEAYSHSTPVKKICELIGPENVYSFGIRSGMKEEFLYAETSGMHLYKYHVLEPLKNVLPTLQGKNVYVTIDIDVLDPASAPGTGTQEVGGITSNELLAAIHAIAGSEVNIVGCDLVEVSPPYDNSDQTAIAASKFVREMLLGFTK